MKKTNIWLVLVIGATLSFQMTWAMGRRWVPDKQTEEIYNEIKDVLQPLTRQHSLPGGCFLQQVDRWDEDPGPRIGIGVSFSRSGAYIQLDGEENPCTRVEKSANQVLITCQRDFNNSNCPDSAPCFLPPNKDQFIFEYKQLPTGKTEVLQFKLKTLLRGECE